MATRTLFEKSGNSKIANFNILGKELFRAEWKKNVAYLEIMVLSFLNIFKMYRKRKNRIVLIKLHEVLSYRKRILNWERLIFSATFYFQVITQMFFLYFFVFQKKQLLGKNNIFGERKSIANIFGSQSVEKKLSVKENFKEFVKCVLLDKK